MCQAQNRLAAYKAIKYLLGELERQTRIKVIASGLATNRRGVEKIVKTLMRPHKEKVKSVIKWSKPWWL